jgi:flagellar hook assembly protein FlgD
VGLSGSTGVGDLADSRFELSGPSPNPFLSQTSGSVTLAHPAHMIIRIMDLQGRSVRRLVAAGLEAGRHGWTWDGRDDRGDQVASGTYLLEVTDESSRAVRRIVRLR